MYGVRKCSSFILLQVVEQFSQHHLLKRLSFLHCIFLPIVNDKMSIVAWIYLWAFYFVPLIYISVFVPVPYCLDDCGFVVEPEVRRGWFLQFHSSFSRLLWLFEVFCISIQIMKLFVLVLWRNTIGSLIGIALNLYIALGTILIFSDSSNPWTWYISPSISVLFDFFHQCFIVFYI